MTSTQKNSFVSKMTIINKERCSSEDFKYFQSNRLKELYKSKEERNKVSKRSKALWKTKEYRDKINYSRNKYFQSDRYKLDMEKKSKHMKEYWSNEENRKKMSETQKSIWTDEKRKEHGEFLKSKFKNNEQLKEKHSVSTKEMWKNPKYREIMSNSAKKNNLSKYGTEARKVKLKFTDKNGNNYIFDSRKAFENFCKNEYGKILDARHYNDMIAGNPYYSRYKYLQNIFGNCKLEKID